LGSIFIPIYTHNILQDATSEKAVDESSDKKTEMVYMDKMNECNEDANVRGDRRLYAKLY